MKSLYIGVAVGLLSVSMPAFAAPVCSPGASGQEECICSVPLSTAAPYFLDSVSGGVVVTAQAGFSPATGGALTTGDRIVIPAGGQALLSGVSCNAQLPDPSTVVIKEIDGCACAALTKADVAGIVGGGGTANAGGAAAAGIVGVAGAGGLVALGLSEDDDKPVSP